ncbi:hypothetical protein ES332_D10G124400v1 [Gossypium tomentosum]|uniref:RING-type E3 ubiquitin transferase n=1 Tax=Gossypium tomentosum TaxID=34277 RepID=A0A5D2J4A3_GOSTO|nr:hypothetical protein ES332_D10G124400v1 [Gossypium tomentosum]
MPHLLRHRLWQLLRTRKPTILTPETTALMQTLLWLSSGSGASTSGQPSNRGINRKALKTFPTVNYSADLNMPGLDSECVICLSDFKPGDRVRLLPMCNHGFHVQCINKWLSCRSSCPKCRHCLVETCQKIVVFSSQASSSQPTPVQETAVP